MSPLISDTPQRVCPVSDQGRAGATKYMEEGEHPQTWMLASLAATPCHVHTITNLNYRWNKLPLTSLHAHDFLRDWPLRNILSRSRLALKAEFMDLGPWTLCKEVNMTHANIALNVVM